MTPATPKTAPGTPVAAAAAPCISVPLIVLVVNTRAAPVFIALVICKVVVVVAAA